jgi:chemotaxis protein CheC
MYITSEQQDALSELINIGFGRAAATLSVLVGQRVLLEAPRIEILSVAELMSTLLPLSTGNDLVIQQNFILKEQVSGNSFMFMDVAGSTILLDLLSGGEGESHEITDDDREAIVEICNILVNSYIGSFANVLSMPVTFSVPVICEETLDGILMKYQESKNQLNYTLLVKTDFHFINHKVSGYIILIIGGNSLRELFRVVGKISNPRSFSS